MYHFIVSKQILPIIICICCCLHFDFCQAQISGKITYNGSWPVSPYRIIEGKGELVFTSSKSFLHPTGQYRNLYFYGKSQVDIENKSDDPSHLMTHSVYHGDTSKMRNNTTLDPFNIYVDNQDGWLYQRIILDELLPGNNVKDSSVLIKEKTGIILWKVIDEQKTIGNFNCQKATTKFRGRKYTVWFTPDIPVPYGPWKFYGLPGLILEVADDKNEVSFHAVSIQIDDNHASIELPKIPIISLDEYIELSKRKISESIKRSEEMARRAQSRLPKGFQMTSEQSYKLNGIQLEY